MSFVDCDDVVSISMIYVSNCYARLVGNMLDGYVQCVEMKDCSAVPLRNDYECMQQHSHIFLFTK